MGSNTIGHASELTWSKHFNEAACGDWNCTHTLVGAAVGDGVGACVSIGGAVGLAVEGFGVGAMGTLVGASVNGTPVVWITSPTCRSIDPDYSSCGCTEAHLSMLRSTIIVPTGWTTDHAY
jgi:hypothetical protein